MFRILFLLLLPSSLVCFGGQAVIGALNISNQTPRHTITGTVTNAVTGEPVRRALVQMNGAASGAVLTSSDGRFQFADVPEGPAVFSLQKPGFSDTRFTPGSPWAAPNAVVTVGSGKNDFHLALLPNSKIIGHIIDADGEPLANVQVQILLEQIWRGRRQWQARNSASTDEDGSYRVEDLTAGRYVVFAMGGAVPQQSSNGPREVIAPRYYPAAPDLASAQPVDLRAGQEFRADFRLRAERGYRLTAQVSGAPAGQGVGFSMQNADGQNFWSEGMQYDPAHGQLIVPALPPGLWTLFLNANDTQGHGYQTRQEIAVGHTDLDLQIPLRPAASIPVTVNHPATQAVDTEQPQLVQMINGQKVMNPGISVNLISTDASSMQSVGLQMQGDPPVLGFNDVPPGKYKLDVQAFGNECVESAWYGSVDLTRDYVVIDTNGGTQPLTINLRADCATLTAKLSPEERSHSGFVLIVPGSSVGEPKILQVQQTSPPSVFTGFAYQSLTLSPGSYQVFALTSVEGLEYSNPEALRNYPSQSVNLGPGQKTELTVELTERKEN
jgi:carboxypeptidase family protein